MCVCGSASMVVSVSVRVNTYTCTCVHTRTHVGTPTRTHRCTRTRGFGLEFLVVGKEDVLPPCPVQTTGPLRTVVRGLGDGSRAEGGPSPVFQMTCYPVPSCFVGDFPETKGRRGDPEGTLLCFCLGRPSPGSTSVCLRRTAQSLPWGRDSTPEGSGLLGVDSDVTHRGRGDGDATGPTSSLRWEDCRGVSYEPGEFVLTHRKDKRSFLSFYVSLITLT